MLIKPPEDKSKEISKLEKKVLEKEIEIDEIKHNNKVLVEDNKKQKIQINKFKEKIKNLEEKNYTLNELIKSFSQGKSQNNNEAKNLLIESSSTHMNQNQDNINNANINNINIEKEKEEFNKKIKDLNNQIETLKKENDRFTKELKEKESQNKNLKKDLKEKEERISALETEIKLKEKEENRLNRGKLKESALYDNNNNNDINNELKMSQLAEEDKINDLGLSQEELLKENEKLKDQIMLLKKDLELARASQQIDSINKEDKKDENQKNSKDKNILKDSYMSLGMDYQN